MPDATADQVAVAEVHIRNALHTIQSFGTDLNAGQVYSMETELGAALTALGLPTTGLHASASQSDGNDADFDPAQFAATLAAAQDALDDIVKAIGGGAETLDLSTGASGATKAT